MTLLVVVGLIAEQQSSCPTDETPSTFIHTFDVKQIILNVKCQTTLIIGECIKEIIIKTSNECLPLLRGKIDELFNAIVNTRVDPSLLKSQIEKYMVSVDCLDTVQHTHSMKICS